MSVMDRFKSKYRVNPVSGCWKWIASYAPGGYGQFCFDGSMRRAHRVSWIIHNGPIPEGMLVCHRCDNPSCVNPEHLFLGTHKDNMRDMIAKGRDNLVISPKGEDQHLSKLTEDKVLSMRKLRKETGMPYIKIGELFGISESASHAAITKVTWRHI